MNNDNGAEVTETAVVADVKVPVNKTPRRTFADVQREFHEAVARADGASHRRLESNRDGTPYPKFFVTPEEAWEIVSALALELAQMSASLGRRE